MTPPERPPRTIRAAGHTVRARAGRVFLIDERPFRDPDLTVVQARALAAALVAAAEQAEKQGARRPPDSRRSPR